MDKGLSLQRNAHQGSRYAFSLVTGIEPNPRRTLRYLTMKVTENSAHQHRQEPLERTIGNYSWNRKGQQALEQDHEH